MKKSLTMSTECHGSVFTWFTFWTVSVDWRCMCTDDKRNLQDVWTL